VTKTRILEEPEIYIARFGRQ